MLLQRATPRKIAGRANKLLNRIRHALQRPTIYMVSDGANWAFDWVAHYVVTSLAQEGIAIQMTSTPNSIRESLLHFGSRYELLSPDSQFTPNGNRVFVTWFHGAPADPNFSAYFAELQARLGQVARVLTSCSISREQLVAAGIPAEKVVVIPIGVDTGRFRPFTTQQRQSMRTKLGIPQDAFCIGSFQKDGVGWAAGNDPKLIKGPDVFLQVIGALRTAIPRLHVLLTAPARGYIKNGLDALGVAYTHEVLDDYWDVVPYYHALDLYLITSRVEGGPKGLMESWASGVPVVSTDMGMPADYIRHGDNGMLAPVDSQAELAAHVLTLYEDAALRRHIREQALQDVQVLDWRRVAQQYFHKLYAPYYKPRWRTWGIGRV